MWDTTLAPAWPGQHRVATPTAPLASTTPWAFQGRWMARPSPKEPVSRGQEPGRAEPSCPACGAHGDTAVTGQIETGSKRLEKRSGVFNTDMTSWPGATGSKPRRGIALTRRARGAGDRHPGTHQGQPLPLSPGCRTPPARSATHGEIPACNTTPNKPSLSKPPPWSLLQAAK